MRKIAWSVFLILLLFSSSTHASKIEPQFPQVELHTRISTAQAYVIPEETKIIQGTFEIQLKGIGNKKDLEIKFLAANPEVYQLMAHQLEIQYCIVSDETEGQWSEWKYLYQLPLKIDLREVQKSLADPRGFNNSPAQVVILLRFKVPQSVGLRNGVYEGEFLLKIS